MAFFNVFCKLLGFFLHQICQVNLQGTITDMFPWFVVFCERQAAETKSSDGGGGAGGEHIHI